ncbi:glutathione S-transferase [Thraustotheca clavata]|uniref:Glutathione S-transferase n=1 Tax=Thraustotheca clavata TaxID=74557 RepID=A0A1V9ZCT4_9STRA|nr:glutathione S-transferase [Thraustotheca clavata]
MNHKSKMSKPDTSASIYKWADQKDGQFRRQVSSFRDFIGSERFPAEKGRYHLYISWACPWAHRTAIVRKLKGLESVIGLSVVSYLMTKEGWHFSTPEETPGATIDEVNGAKFIREIYFKAEPEFSGRFTVPVLWDKKNNTIVNNESSEIIRMLNSEFNAFSTKPQLDLYPQTLRKEIDEINEWIYDGINNGVYKSGFATKQDVYETNVTKLFAALDRVEAHLDGKSWLIGEKFTEADVRLFTTILRFDPVYHTHFKCNLKTISHDYPNLLKHARRIYQIEGIVDTINMTHIKGHYYESHLHINPFGIVPLWNGPDLAHPKVESNVF